MASLEQYRYPQIHPDPAVHTLLYDFFADTRKYYPTGSADAVLHHECVYLCAETAKYIYSGDFTKETTSYMPGSRPYLEGIVSRLTRAVDDPLKRACRIMDFTRDNAYHAPRVSTNDMVFYGGSEEDVIRKRTGMCNEIARLACILAQIAGMPARLCGHINPKCAHSTLEILVDGKWGWFDVRGQTFLNKDGSVASLWDLMQNFDALLPIQPDWLRRRCLGARFGDPASRYSLEAGRQWIKESHSFIANYDLAMASRINFTWCWNQELLANSQKKEYRASPYQPEDLGFQVDDIPGH